MNTTQCKSCGLPIALVRLDTGKWIPIDLEKRLEPRAMMVAYNPRTKRGRVIRKDEVGDAHLWVFKGARLYKSHFATCPHASTHRKRAVEKPAPAVPVVPQLGLA